MILCPGVTFKPLSDMPRGGVDGHLTSKDRYCSDKDLSIIHELLGKHLTLIDTVDEHLLYVLPATPDDTGSESKVASSDATTDSVIRIPLVSISQAYEKDCKLWNCFTLYPEHTPSIKLGVLECTLPADSAVVELLVIIHDASSANVSRCDTTAVVLSKQDFNDRVVAKRKRFNIEHTISADFKKFYSWMTDGGWLKTADGKSKLFYPA
jgi:hypothetical protein